MSALSKSTIILIFYRPHYLYTYRLVEKYVANIISIGLREGLV